jgi:hypothetical protein
VYKHLCCQTPERLIRVGWVSFMPDGSISVGLTDKTFFCEPFQSRQNIYNAYNQIAIHHIVPSMETAGLIPVNNPHFTFHPPMIFQLTCANVRREKALFRGIADPIMTLEQQHEVPWIRAASPPLDTMPTGGTRDDKINVETLTLASQTENASVGIGIDFVNAGQRAIGPHDAQWEIPWQGLTLSIGMILTERQRATISWFHVA